MFDNRGNSSLVPTRALLVSSEIYKPLLLNSCAQGVSGKNKQTTWKPWCGDPRSVESNAVALA